MTNLTTDSFANSKRSPDELLNELKNELPKAEQAEEEHRAEVARRANQEPSWDIPVALAWIRFRDVKQSCRFLERRDALLSLWRDGLETEALEQLLAGGELVCTGVRGGVRGKISPEDWRREDRQGLRLIRATEPPRRSPGVSERLTPNCGSRAKASNIDFLGPTARKVRTAGRSPSPEPSSVTAKANTSGMTSGTKCPGSAWRSRTNRKKTTYSRRYAKSFRIVSIAGDRQSRNKLPS